MPNILPVSDLRNYNKVLKNCRKGEPVYLTKNGRGSFVLMDIEDYQRERAEKKLLIKFQVRCYGKSEYKSYIIVPCRESLEYGDRSFRVEMAQRSGKD